MIKVIAFDVFNTVFSLKDVRRQELRDYADHIKKPWSPLTLPKSWETLPAHPDAAEGVRLLRENYVVVTCSNGPLGLLTKLSKYNKISWDAIVPLELFKTFKPNPGAYLGACEALGVVPTEVMMVTANRTFGDLEASAALGMTPMLIRDEQAKFKTIIDLAKGL